MGLSFTFNGSSIQIRIRKLKWSMITKATSVFKDPDVAETMSIIHYFQFMDCGSRYCGPLAMIVRKLSLSMMPKVKDGNGTDT
jgi:hypothetical protein